MNFFSKLSICFFALMIMIGSMNVAHAQSVNGRIAISADGNAHDRDDIGAFPMSLALLAKAGLQSKVVFGAYNDHIWNNENASQYQAMTSSATGAVSRFGFNSSKFHNAINNPTNAYNKLAAEINASSSSNPLTILAMGPMNVVCQGILRSSSSKRQYVTVISHSTWNEDHTHNSSDCTWTGKNGRTSLKSTGVKTVDIKDQNGTTSSNGLSTSYSYWSWLQNHADSNLRWVYSRMQVAFSSKADVSDAGEVWYLIKNKDQNASVSKLQSFFGSGSSGGGGSSSGGECSATGSSLSAAISAFQNKCGVSYDKSKGHDCDPTSGGYKCSNGEVGSGSSSGGSTGGSSGGSSGGSTGGSSGGSSSGGECSATGSSLTAAKSAFQSKCNVTYNKNLGHDCDPISGGYKCSNGQVGSGSSSSGSTGGSSGGSTGGGACSATGSSITAAKSAFESKCNVSYNKSLGHDCDPVSGGYKCSNGDL